MDTKYFRQALEEFALKRSAQIKAGDLTVGELSWLLRRAQELKDGDDRADEEARRGTCVRCGRRDFTEPCDSPLGHKLFEPRNPVTFLQGKPQPVIDMLDQASDIFPPSCTGKE